MHFSETDPTDDGLALCREARRLRALHQNLLRERARLLADLWDICCQAQERLATAQHFNARLAESAQPAIGWDQERKNLAEQALHPTTPARSPAPRPSAP